MFLGILGAYLTGEVSPYAGLAIQAAAGAILFIKSIFLPLELEIEGDFEAEQLISTDPTRSGVHLRRSFCQELAHNYHIVRNALRVRELQTTLLFYVLVGVTHPVTIDFMYFFKTEVIEISQTAYQLLFVLGGVYLTLAMVCYKMFLSHWETRSLIVL